MTPIKVIGWKEEDIHICGFCKLWSKDLSLCLLKGEETSEDESCEKWLEDNEE